MRSFQNRGNVVVIAMLFVGISLIIFMFIIAIYMSNINSILYGVKTDMYSINKSAVIAVNKNQANIDNFTYNEKEYKKYFEEMLKRNYGLNDDLENQTALINRLKIKEYKIYNVGKKDEFTGEKCKNTTIHTVVEVRIKPIILKKVLEKLFIFTIHEDVNLNMAKYDN